MEENHNDDATPFDIHAAVAESNPELQESTEQQGESTEESTETVDLTEEANNSTDEEISEAEATEGEEANTEESNEEDSTDSDIVDLNADNTTEQTTEGEEESQQTPIDHYSEMLDGQFENEEDLNNHLLELESKITELEGKAPEFANEAVAKLNEYVLNGGTVEQFTRVQGVDVDNMNAVDILTTELMWNNKDFTRDDALNYLERKFPDSLDDDGKLDANDPMLKVDANKAAEIIKSAQAEDNPVNPGGISEEEWNERTAAEKQEAQDAEYRATEERMEEWMQPVEDELDHLKENGLIVPLTDEKGVRFPFTMDEAYEDELIAKVDKTLMTMGTSFKENPKAARNLMELHFRNDNFDKIVQYVAEKGANLANEEWFKKVHNPSVISRGDEAPASDSTIPTAEEAMSKVMGQ